jgi:ATP-dependent Clp protease adapter protein ClpS
MPYFFILYANNQVQTIEEVYERTDELTLNHKNGQLICSVVQARSAEEAATKANDIADMRRQELNQRN